MFLVAFTMACNSKDPLTLLMADLEEAAEALDVSGIENRLASEFSGNDGISRDETLAVLRRYFVAYEQIRLDVTDVERSKEGNRVTFLVSFSGQGNTAFKLQNLLPSAAEYSFELRLVQEADMLKVKQASWLETSVSQP